jgi:hypothetical protein
MMGRFAREPALPLCEIRCRVPTVARDKTNGCACFFLYGSRAPLSKTFSFFGVAVNSRVTSRRPGILRLSQTPLMILSDPCLCLNFESIRIKEALASNQEPTGKNYCLDEEKIARMPRFWARRPKPKLLVPIEPGNLQKEILRTRALVLHRSRVCTCASYRACFGDYRF